MAVNYRLEERRDARNYNSPDEKQAFAWGYSDGFAGYARDEHAAYLNAYSAGYWEGVADGKSE